MDPDETVYDAFSESDYVWIGDTRHHKRDYLGRFLFGRKLLKSPVKMLSGGQLRRLRLARVIAQNANLLILDEPTNDLDMASLSALEDALLEFEGCILLVSHDRYFLNRVCNSICAFEDGVLVRYWGDYDAYREERDAKRERRAARDAQPAPAQKTPDKPSAEQQAEQQAEHPEQKGLTWKEERRLEAVEEEIAQLEATKSGIEAELADPALYSSRTDEIAGLNADLRDVAARLDALYEEWESLEARRG